MSHMAALFGFVRDLCLGATFCDQVKAADTSGDVCIAANVYSSQDIASCLPWTRLTAANEIA